MEDSIDLQMIKYYPIICLTYLVNHLLWKEGKPLYTLDAIEDNVMLFGTLYHILEGTETQVYVN